MRGKLRKDSNKFCHRVERGFDGNEPQRRRERREKRVGGEDESAYRKSDWGGN